MKAKFTACVSGCPEPEIEWYKNGNKIFSGDRIRVETERNGLLRLVVHDTRESDSGRYTCRAKNKHGEDSCSADLTCEETKIPKPGHVRSADDEKFRAGVPLPLPDRPYISKMTDSRLTLSWKPSIACGPKHPIQYQVEMLELPDGDWFVVRGGIRGTTCEIKNLEPYRDYRFRIRSEDRHGVSEPSAWCQTYRERLEPEPRAINPYLPKGFDFRPHIPTYFPKDYDIEKPSHDGYAEPPK